MNNREHTIFVGGPFSSALTKTDEGFIFDKALQSAFETTHSAVKEVGSNLLASHITDEFGNNFPVPECSMVQRDCDWVKQCSLYLALLPLCPDGSAYRTDGTYVEIGFAIGLSVPVLLVMQGRQHSSQSYFVRHLDTMPNVTIIEWEDFFANPVEVLLGYISTKSQYKQVPRTQTTDVVPVLDSLHQRKGKEEVIVRGVPMIVYPDVLSPSISHSPDFVMDNWSIPKDADVLDVGTGCGILALFAFREGARSLVAIDINPEAVKNTQENIDRHGYSNCSRVILSNALTELSTDDKFDVIIHNPPYWDRKATTLLELSCYDEHHEFAKKVIGTAKHHLRPTGCFYIGFADQGDVNLLNQIIQEAGYIINDLILQRPSIPQGHIRVLWKLSYKP